jgi:hypothetical protein
MAHLTVCLIIFKSVSTWRNIYIGHKIVCGFSLQRSESTFFATFRYDWAIRGGGGGSDTAVGNSAPYAGLFQM